MSYFSTNGLIGYLSLDNYIIDKKLKRFDIVLGKILNKGIRVCIFNNGYYFLDFNDAMVGKQGKCYTRNDIRLGLDSEVILIQRSTINALNACLYIVEYKSIYTNNEGARKRQKNINDIDQFFIPCLNDYELEYIIDDLGKCEELLEFSSEPYRLAFKYLFSKKPKKSISKEIIESGIEMFNKILDDDAKEYNQMKFYILSNIWKTYYYYLYDRRVEASVFARSVFEVMVARKFKCNDREKGKFYERYCDDKEKSEFITNFRESIRDLAVHELKVTVTPDEIKQFIKNILFFFERDFELNISYII